MFILYDNDGKIIMTKSGGDEIAANSIHVMVAEIPSGFGVTSIDMATGEPVLYEIEKSAEFKKMELMTEQISAIYTKMSEGYAGTAENPIPWVYGMECKEGVCYSYNGVTYRIAKGGYMNPCVWQPDCGIWQFEVIG